MFGAGRMAGKFEGENGAEAGTVAADAERAAEETGGVGGVVQAEAVPPRLGGEAVAEDGEKLVGVDADAVVDDGDVEVGFGGAPEVDAQGGIGGGHGGERGAGVGEKVDQDLNDGAAVRVDEMGAGNVGAVDDPEAGGGGVVFGFVDEERLVDRFGEVEGFAAAGGLGQGLLAGDDLLEVGNAGAEGGEFLLGFGEMGGGVVGVGGGELAKRGTVGMRGEDGGGLGRGGGEKLAQGGGGGVGPGAKVVGEKLGGDVDAVEGVADVVEHAGGDLGHAGRVGKPEHVAGVLPKGVLGGLAFLDLLVEGDELAGEGFVATADLHEHGVEGFGERGDLGGAAGDGADGIVSPGGDVLGGAGEFDDRRGDGVLEAAGEQQGEDDGEDEGGAVDRGPGEGGATELGAVVGDDEEAPVGFALVDDVDEDGGGGVEGLGKLADGTAVGDEGFPLLIVEDGGDDERIVTKGGQHLGGGLRVAEGEGGGGVAAGDDARGGLQGVDEAGAGLAEVMDEKDGADGKQNDAAHHEGEDEDVAAKRRDARFHGVGAGPGAGGSRGGRAKHTMSVPASAGRTRSRAEPFRATKKTTPRAMRSLGGSRRIRSPG